MGNVWVKQGVCGDLQPIARKGYGKLALFYFELGKDFFETSRREGNHCCGSLHYDGLAFDFKRQGVAMDTLRKVLGSDWDLVDEITHVHAEYDPT